MTDQQQTARRDEPEPDPALVEEYRKTLEAMAPNAPADVRQRNAVTLARARMRKQQAD